MKQTNNAIKFLIAQYRAIFQNAYLKGFAGALILGTTLAIPSSFAANSKLPTLQPNDNHIDYDIYIESGSLDDNQIINNTDTITYLKAQDQKLTVNIAGDNPSDGLSILGGDEAVKMVVATFKDIDILSGTLKVGGNKGQVQLLHSGKLTIGGGLKKGILEFGANNNLVGTGSSTPTTAFVIKENGQLKAMADNSSVLGIMKANTLNMTGGSIDIGAKGASDDSTLALTLNGGVIGGGKVNIGTEGAGKAALNLEFKNTTDVLNIAGGEISIGEKGKIELKKGTLVASSERFTDPTSAAGLLNVTGGSTLVTDAALAKKVKLNIGENSTLDFGSQDLDLTASNSDIKFAGHESGDGKGTIGIQNKKTTVKLGSLTINEANQGTPATYKVNSLKVVDESALSASNFNVAQELNLAGKTTFNTDLTLEGNESGSITGGGTLVLGNNGNLNIAQGSWQSSNDIDIGTGADAGTLNVGTKAVASASSVVSSSLSVAQGQKFNFNVGTIKVGGSNNSNAVLDLTQGVISLQNAKTGSSIVVDKGGTLKLKGEDLGQLTSATYLKTILSGNSTLEVTGAEASLDLAKLTYDAPNEGQLQVLGSLVTDGNLILKGNSQNYLHIDDAAKVQAKTIQLTGSNDDSYVISGGQLVAAQGINADPQATIKIKGDGPQASLTLGSEGTSEGQVKAGAISIESGKLNVANGNWDLVDVSMAGNGASQLNVEDAASFKTSKLTVNQGKVNIKTGAAATVDALKSAGNDGIVNVSGTLTIQGSAAGGATKGIDVASNSINVGNGGNVIITGEALSLIKNDGSTTGFKDGAIKSEAGSTVTLTYGSDMSFTTDEIKQLRTDLLSVQPINQHGFINLGDAQITGVQVTDGKIRWHDAEQVADIQSTNFALASANVYGIDQYASINGSFGSVSFESNADNLEQFSIKSETILQNASGNNGLFASDSTSQIVKGLDIKGGTTHLKNGGSVGKITLAESTGLKIDSGTGETIVSGDIATENGSGKSGGNLDFAGATKVTGSVEASKIVISSGKTQVVGNSTANGALDIAAGAEFVVGGLLTTNDAATVDGTLTTKEASFNKAVTVNGSLNANKATFTDAAKLYGDVTIDGEGASDGVLTANKALDIQNGTVKAKSVTLASTEEMTISQGASLVAETLTAKQDGVIKVGEVLDANAAEDAIGTGYLDVERLKLNGASLVVDPSWDEKASIAAIGAIGDAMGNNTQLDGKVDNAGTLTGEIYALQNAVVSLGADATEVQKVLSDAGILVDGKLSNEEGKVGAVLYLAKSLKVDGATNSKIVVDKTHNSNNYNDPSVNYTGDLYLGAGSSLVVTEGAVLKSTNSSGDQEAAIVFDKTGARVHVESGASVILTGNAYKLGSNISLFKDNDLSSSGVLIEGNDLVVKSANGVLNMTFEAGQDALTNSFALKTDPNKARQVFSTGSSVANDIALKYAVGYKELDDKDQGIDGTQIHSGMITQDAWSRLSKSEQANYTASADGQTYYKLRANKFLNNVIIDGGSAQDIDLAMRAGAFTGMAQVAMAAGNTNANAVASRFALGSSPVNVSTKANDMGGALFVAPIYSSMDSDGFAAHGTNYGVDMDLYGAAIGADYELFDVLRVGALVNFGKGDTEGNGAANGAKNEFSYFGVGLFASYQIGDLNLLGDINYTQISNDLELNLESIGKYTTSLDSTNINAGVTAQYKFDIEGFEVMPHAGIRYTMIEADDYTIKDAGSYKGDDVSIVSIPVGVSVAKEFKADDWVIKPNFDVTLTAITGDDSLTGTFTWADVVDFSANVESEIIDNFSYAASVGVTAQSGNFAGALSVNYTGSSNCDSFAVTASARYLF